MIKQCSAQLAPIWTRVLNRSLLDGVVPLEWKTSTLVPIPKLNLPSVKNDLRPVALTDLLIKCFGRLFATLLIPQVRPHWDSLQVTYQQGHSVVDAVATLLQTLYSHLEKQGSYSRALYVDFSSAFNTISSLMLTRLLIEMNVNTHLIHWIVSFLTDRRQRVRFKDTMSSYITTNTGVPQGCVLSPLLFTTYTSNCRTCQRTVP